MDFFSRPDSLNQAFKLIAQTQTGRTVLEAFLPKYKKGLISIEPYPVEVLTRLKSIIGPKQPVGACFMNDGKNGTIYFDPESPLGVLAPFLVHEMIHSLDATLWELAAVPVSQKTKDQIFLRAEAKAFDVQHRFTQELKKTHPHYEQFLSSYSEEAKILIDQLTQTDIADLYGFKAS